MKAILLSSIILLSGCASTFNPYKAPEIPSGSCPSPLWIREDIAAEFRKYPPGHPMREFFKGYVQQQRDLDNYWGVHSMPNSGR